jgi:class 3 adenylate cyclase
VATATITILFCDLVGSTAFHARPGDDAADEVRRACFAAWRDAIAAAVASQRATVRVDQATRDADIALRVGVSVGEATEEDGD